MTKTADICILGGGIAALYAAQQLRTALPAATLRLFAAGKSNTAGKTIIIDRNAADALAEANALPPASRPIEQVDISVGGIRHTIGSSGKPVGYSIDADDVQQRLRSGLDISPAYITHISPPDNDTILLTADSGEATRTRLLIIACPLPAPALPPPFTTRRLPYRQTIFSLTAGTPLAKNRAQQRFSCRRVLVLVPRAQDDETGIIIITATATAGTISTMSDSTLSDYLSREFQLPIRAHGKRFCYTPELVRHTPLCSAPIILLGSGATVLHPIGAQAISLAIADAQQLAATVAACCHSSSDKKSALPPPAAWESYRRRRTLAHRKKTLFTSTLALGAFGAAGLF